MKIYYAYYAKVRKRFVAFYTSAFQLYFVPAHRSRTNHAAVLTNSKDDLAEEEVFLFVPPNYFSFGLSRIGHFSTFVAGVVGEN